MMKKPSILLSVLLVSQLAICAYSAEPADDAATPPVHPPPRGAPSSARVGDQAPRLEITDWVKGGPIDLTKGTNIYLIEFCGGLTRTSDMGLTNLSYLQNKYQSIGVVAAAICEEPADLLRDFVKTQSTKINYAVAADGRPMAMTFMHTFNQMAYPSVFVVGQGGKVLWYGHPLRGLEDVLEQLKSGQYTTQWAARKVADRKQMEMYLNLASRNDPKAPQIGQMMLAVRTNDGPALLDLAFRIASDGYLEKRDAALANAALDRAASLSPTNAFRVAWTRAILTFTTGKMEDGLAQAKQVLASAKNPDDVVEAKTSIHAMEVIMAREKTKTPAAAGSKP